MAKRTAKTTWKGTLIDGRGELTLESSGLLSRTQVTWASRTEEPRGTSPEELLAGAQAACYAMALSNTLAQQGTPPDRKSTRLNSSHVRISYAVFCLKKKNTQ